MNILLFSPYFAPYINVGALRMNSLAQYLLAQGHDVSVIKMKNRCYPPQLATGECLEGITYYEFDFELTRKKASRQQLADFLDRVLQTQVFDCLLATFGPDAPIFAICRIMKKYKIPLIVDYRDLLLYDPRPRITIQEKLSWPYRYILFKRHETQLMKVCSAFVTVTPRSVQIMERKYPCLNGKAFCIYNGYTPIPIAPDDFNGKSKNVFTICALGKFSGYTKTGAEAVLTAVHRINTQGIPVQIRHFGSEERDIHDICSKLQITSEEYCGCGQLPYRQVMQKANCSDAYAIVIDYSIGLGTKLFDYIYLNRPIVVYAPPKSEVEEVLQGAENAYVCQNADQIEAALKDIIAKKKTCLTEDESYVKRFSREAQNERYLQLMEKVRKN